MDIYDENAEEEGNCYMHVAMCAKHHVPINTFSRRKNSPGFAQHLQYQYWHVSVLHFDVDK